MNKLAFLILTIDNKYRSMSLLSYSVILSWLCCDKNRRLNEKCFIVVGFIPVIIGDPSSATSKILSTVLGPLSVPIVGEMSLCHVEV